LFNDGFVYRNRREILGQQTGHGHEFPKIQSKNCLQGRESPGSKDFKRVSLTILPNPTFACPTHIDCLYLCGHPCSQSMTIFQGESIQSKPPTIATAIILMQMTPLVSIIGKVDTQRKPSEEG
jgi:hypothetical protein